MTHMVVRRTWYGLSKMERREVARHAKAERPHPHPEVDRAVLDWARQTLGSRQTAIDMIAGILGGLLDGVSGGAWWGQARGDRRLARRLLRAHGEYGAE